LFRRWRNEARKGGEKRKEDGVKQGCEFMSVEGVPEGKVKGFNPEETRWFWTSKKVVPVFGNASAGGRTSCSWAVGKFELLCLKGQKIVGPFDDEEALKKRKLQGAAMIEFPIHEIEDGAVGPVMMRLEVKAILGEPA
jgi:hypothetical protein